MVWQLLQSFGAGYVTHTVANASLTRLRRDAVGAPWSLEEFSSVGHLDDDVVTEHGGRKDDARVR